MANNLQDREENGMTVLNVPGQDQGRSRHGDVTYDPNYSRSNVDVQTQRPASTSAEVAKPQTQVCTCDKEIKLLKQKLKLALETKSKWQSYDRSRDELVNRLESEKRELQAKLSQVRPSDLLGSERDDVILYWKRKAEEEGSLRKRLEEVNRSQELFIQNLQLALQQSQATSQGADRERVEILENQVKIFSEDFEQERHDRERAQARANELEEELQLVRLELSQFQDETMSRLAGRRRHTINTYRAEYNRQVALQSPSERTSRLIPHGVVEYDPPDIDGESSDEDCLEDLPMSHSLKPNTLDCPKCHKQFPTSDPMSFLDHNELCSYS